MYANVTGLCNGESVCSPYVQTEAWVPTD